MIPRRREWDIVFILKLYTSVLNTHILTGTCRGHT